MPLDPNQSLDIQYQMYVIVDKFTPPLSPGEADNFKFVISTEATKIENGNPPPPSGGTVTVPWPSPNTIQMNMGASVTFSFTVPAGELARPGAFYASASGGSTGSKKFNLVLSETSGGPAMPGSSTLTAVSAPRMDFMVTKPAHGFPVLVPGHTYYATLSTTDGSAATIGYGLVVYAPV